MLGGFVMIQAKTDSGLDHCGNDGNVSVQILSTLLIIEPSGFARELDVDCGKKRSQGWQPEDFKKLNSIWK